MQKKTKEVWDTISYEKYGNIFNTPQTTLKYNYSDKEILYTEAVRRGLLENVLDIDISTLKPLIFKNEIAIQTPAVNNLPTNKNEIAIQTPAVNNLPTNKNEIAIKKPKVNNLPTTIKKVNVKDILLEMNEKEDFSECNELLNIVDRHIKHKYSKYLNNNEIRDEDIDIILKLVRQKHLLNSMKFWNKTSFGELKTYKSLEGQRKACLEYQQAYFGTENIENIAILEKKTKKTATFTEEVQEIFNP